MSGRLGIGGERGSISSRRMSGESRHERPGMRGVPPPLPVAPASQLSPNMSGQAGEVCLDGVHGTERAAGHDDRAWETVEGSSGK